MQPAMKTICAAPSYLARFGAPQEPVDLRNHTCVQFTLSGYCDECAFRRGDRSVRFPIAGRYKVTSSLAVRDEVPAPHARRISMRVIGPRMSVIAKRGLTRIGGDAAWVLRRSYQTPPRPVAPSAIARSMSHKLTPHEREMPAHHPVCIYDAAPCGDRRKSSFLSRKV